MVQPYTMSRDDRAIIMDALFAFGNHLMRRYKGIAGGRDATARVEDYKQNTRIYEIIRANTNNNGQVIVGFTDAECVHIIRALNWYDRYLSARYDAKLQDRINYVKWSKSAMQTYRELIAFSCGSVGIHSRQNPL